MLTRTCFFANQTVEKGLEAYTTRWVGTSRLEGRVPTQHYMDTHTIMTEPGTASR